MLKFGLTLKTILFWLCDTREIIILIIPLKQWPYFNAETTSLYPRLINVENLTLKQRWFWLDTNKLFTPVLWCSINYSLCINAVKITVFQCRNKVIWSTLYQRQKLMLKQRWFQVDSNNLFLLLCHDAR